MGAIGGHALSRWEQIDGSGGGSSIRGGKEERIVVSVRMRPMNEMELGRHDICEWDCINDTTIIYKGAAAERSMYPSAYTFDRVFGCNSNTKQVYEEGAKVVALAVISGVNSSVFAYGQTSSGKTYTMAGITEYSVADIYEYIEKHKERVFVLKFSAMEIYNESVRDLLSTDTTPLRLLDDPERGTVVEKLIEETLRDKEHLKELLALCDAQRQIGETCLNEASSRSHQILRLTIESSPRFGKENLSTLAACVNFVDLAGSERASQAMSAGSRLKEGCHINRSLLTLGTVIRKLSKGRNGHVPYRDSKLTRILQTSLGGNARTAVICTMSPAHSHVEQSRNTLLFATCAKEVATNAKVNVVMSDKALVRYLQRELARLENELRSPRLSGISESDALREKDARIKKMEKEMRELIRQRDLAQSRLGDLLRAVGDDSRQWEEISQLSASHVPNEYENEDRLSEASGVSYRNLDFGFKLLKPSHWRNDSTESSLQLFEKLNDSISPRDSISSLDFSGLVTQPEPLDIARNAVTETEDYCKEVRCIEMDGSRASSSEDSNPQLPTMKNNDLRDQKRERGDEELMGAPEEQLKNSEKIIVHEKFQDAVKTVDSIEPNHDASLLLHPAEDLTDFESTVLSRSKSCSPTLSSVPSSLSTPAAEKYGKAQVASNLQNDFYGSCELQGTPEESLDAVELESLSTSGSQFSEQTRKDASEIRKTFGASKEDIAICDSIRESNDIIQGQKHNSSEQDNGRSNTGNCVVDTVKDVRVDSMLNYAEAKSEWSLEFAKKQKEMICLWDACNVSLVHRTYFFLLFRGDPADDVYMEVELRRLLVLKRLLSEENLNNVRSGERKSALASSLKFLRDEKKMLCEQLQKRLSRQEREQIYTKWGIDLWSKQRKLQLVNRLWSKTEDTEHVQESASLVARLNGIVLEQGAARREMFELSITPNKMNQVNGRSYSWRHRKSSFR